MRSQVVLFVFALAGSGLAQDKNPFTANAKEIEAGRVMFRMACAGCHGLHAKGGRGGPDLTGGSFHGGDTDADLYRVISRGVPGSEMPAFGDSMDNEMLWRLVSYVRTLSVTRSAPVAGDRAAGEQLFWGKGSCGQCHRVGTRGSAIGPVDAGRLPQRGDPPEGPAQPHCRVERHKEAPFKRPYLHLFSHPGAKTERR